MPEMPPDTAPHAAASPTDRLNAPLAALRPAVLPWADLAAPLPPGLVLHADPEAPRSGRWQSPRGRLLELETRPETSGRWLGLHLPLPLDDLSPLAWIGLAARSAASEALAVRVCLRSGLAAGGFRDCFFDRHLLSQPAESDHLDMLAPDRCPDLPQRAPWREIVLFLPPHRPLAWALHDLRLFAL